MAIELEITQEILDKLTRKHNVTPDEIAEVIEWHCGPVYIDKRKQHKTVPPTKFITGETLSGRTLKVVFMKMGPSVYRIKSAYPPDEEWNYD